jgi:hypothetical protein
MTVLIGDFFKMLMEKLGFQRKWVQWVMTCVSTVCYTVCFNGVPTHSFSLTRGLRQGDPLSLFVADGLSLLLRHYEGMGQIEGLKVCRCAPSITHLLFTDDSLLFFHANMQQATAVKQLLLVFERCI